MSDDELAAWLRLLLTPGLGRDAARRLLAGCGTPQGVWRSAPATWSALGGAAVAAAMRREPERFAQWLQQTRAWLDGQPQRRLLVLGDADYPQPLLQTADPPLVLFAQGPAGVLARPLLSVVGSRHPTAQGRDNARDFSAELSRRGLVVVSGLAQGIDAAAHEGALAAGAPTVAVVGTGPDTVFPPAHRGLLQRILDGGGLLLSEYVPGTPPLAQNFPQRNRIIAGLGLGTLVVEAALRSGSLITARLAAEAGREVFAIPGSIHAPQSRGCHALIRQGAKLVESAQDVFDELPAAGLAAAAAADDPRPGAAADTGRAGAGRRRARAEDRAGDRADRNDPAAGDDALDRAVLQALGHDPATLDALVARTGTGAAVLLARLLELELQGRVARLPGGLYQSRAAG